jgi:hypothetical protein
MRQRPPATRPSPFFSSLNSVTFCERIQTGHNPLHNRPYHACRSRPASAGPRSIPAMKEGPMRRLLSSMLRSGFAIAAAITAFVVVPFLISAVTQMPAAPGATSELHQDHAP